ncbi:hypothetical protein CEXT_408691, partial [Caerostris extrusa]
MIRMVAAARQDRRQMANNSELEGTMECFIGNSPYGGRCLEVRFCEAFEYTMLSPSGLFTGAVM